MCIPPILFIAPFRYNADLGACAPHFPSSPSSLWYAIVFTAVTLIVPIILIIGCNIKVLMIARYHRHRIASAIYEVTLSAQVTITHQRNPFFVPISTPPKIRARSPFASVLQLIGSVLFMYCPYYVTILWNSSIASLVSGSVPISVEAPSLLVTVAGCLLACSPCVNGLLYGVKSKIMRKTFQNYWRKQKTKSEIVQEIQARTPSTCGSRRPSLSTLAVFNRPIPQRRLSETFFDHEKPLMKRIASEISWRPSSLTFADLNESPAASPIAAAGDAAVAIPHTSSCNTLQIPTKVANDETDLGTSDADREQLAELKNSFRPGGSSAAPSVTSYHSNSGQHKTSLTSALLHKMLRIEIRDDVTTEAYHQPLPQSTHDDSLILRSPRILITRAYSEDDHQHRIEAHSHDTQSAQDLQTVAYTWPATITGNNEAPEVSDDEETADDYSRLLAAAASSMSASNSTTLSSVSAFRPFCSLDEPHGDGGVENRHLGETPDDQQFLLSSWPPTTAHSKTHPLESSRNAMHSTNIWGDLVIGGAAESVVVAERSSSPDVFQEQLRGTDIYL